MPYLTEPPARHGVRAGPRTQFKRAGLTVTQPHAPVPGMAPLLVQSYQVDSCMVCHLAFTPIHSKHHCK